MRSTLVLSVVAAAAVVSAQDCNPSYNVAPSTTCYTNCNVQNGQKYVSGWTMDHTSPNFLKSLTLMCDKTGPNYTAFMTNAGMCMVGCTGDDPNLFNNEFAGACAWWAIHKDDTCATASTTTTAAAATTTVAPVTTTTTTVAAATTTATIVATTVTDALVNTAVSATTGVSSIATVLSTGIPVASTNASASGNSSAIAAATSSGVAPASAATTQTPNSGNKLQLSGYAVALVAGLGYLAF